MDATAELAPDSMEFTSEELLDRAGLALRLSARYGAEGRQQLPRRR
jgi:hypothetical protein